MTSALWPQDSVPFGSGRNKILRGVMREALSTDLKNKMSLYNSSAVSSVCSIIINGLSCKARKRALDEPERL